MSGLAVVDILTRPEFAYYYGDWFWGEELNDWVKSLLLFFDGIAVALPESQVQQRIDANPALAQPLVELGLLHNYWPIISAKLKLFAISPDARDWIDRVNEMYARSPVERRPPVLRSLALVAAANSELGTVLEVLTGRLIRAEQEFGYNPSRAEALAVTGISMSLVQHVKNVAIQPIIENEDSAGYIAAILGARDQGQAAIVTHDIRYVGIDLHAVPLDEVLDFRRQYGHEYRTYSNDVRQFVLHLSLLPEAEKSSALAERRAELDDRAEELRKVGRNAFKRQAVSLGFGLAGAAWTLVHGDPWAALFAASAAAAGITAPTPGPIGAAYSYVLQARAELVR